MPAPNERALAQCIGIESMKKTLLVVLAAALLLPATAHAQRRMQCCRGNPFSFAPYAGVLKDAYDISQDDDNLGYILGFRVGYELSRRSRLVGDVAYAASDNVSSLGGTGTFNVYDNNWIMTTGGAEYDIIPGGTSVTLAAEAGAGWRKISLDDSVDTPTSPDESSGYEPLLLLLPRLSVRHAFSARTALEVSVADYIFPDDDVLHSPALTVGFSFR
jgi:hypothetical protein